MDKHQTELKLIQKIKTGFSFNPACKLISLSFTQAGVQNRGTGLHVQQEPILSHPDLLLEA